MSIPLLFSSTSPHAPEASRSARQDGPAKSAPGYLVRHRGTLTFRIRVPEPLRACLGCTEIRRSLGAASLKEARPRAMKLAVTVHEIFTMVRECLVMREDDNGGGSVQSINMRDGWRRFDPKALASLTDQQIRDMAKAWLDRTLAEGWEGRLLREHTPKDPEQLGEILHGLYVDDMEALEGGDYRGIVATVDEALEAQRVPAFQTTQAREGGGAGDPEDLPRQAKLQYHKLCNDMLRARAAFLEAASSPYFSGRLVPSPAPTISMGRQLLEAWYGPPSGIPGLASLALQAGPAGRVGHAPQAQPEAPSGPRLSAAVQAYIQAKKSDWKQSSQNDIPPQLNQFVEIVRKAVAGSDISINALTRDHVRGYCDIMYALPKRMQKPEYRGKSYKQLGKLVLPEEERLAPKTLATRFTMARSFINWAAKEYRIDAPRLNDAFRMPKGLKGKGKADESSRLAFTPTELMQLFNTATYLEETSKHPSRFWAPVIALFTGMRVSEICRLYLDEIRQVADDEFTAFADPAQLPPPPGEKVWAFDISDRGGDDRPKTPAGERLVPIHPFLIEPLGLLDYADRVRQQGPGGLQLFPEVSPNSKGDMGHAVGTWFTRYRRSLDIGGQAGEISKKVFHSFRHTVIHHLLRVHRVHVQLIQAAIGHEEKGADIGETATYGGDYPISILRDEVIMRLPWDKALPQLAELAASPWARGGRTQGN